VSSMPNSAELSAILRDAMAARRRGRWEEARACFERLREAAAAQGAPEELRAADAHLALLDGDRAAAEEAVARLVSMAPSSPAAAALGMLVAERWPAPPRPRETHLVGHSGAFRRLCRKLPQPGEIALELGASHGLATQFLARKCGQVYAVEKSPEMAERARIATAHLPNVRVVPVDAREPGLVRAHVPHADLVFIDIGGSTPARQVLQTAWVHGEMYQPRVMVIRSVNLNAFVASLSSFEPL